MEPWSPQISHTSFINLSHFLPDSQVLCSHIVMQYSFHGNAKIHALPPDAETTTFKSMALKFFKHVKIQSDNIVGREHIKQLHIVFDR